MVGTMIATMRFVEFWGHQIVFVWILVGKGWPQEPYKAPVGHKIGRFSRGNFVVEASWLVSSFLGCDEAVKASSTVAYGNSVLHGDSKPDFRLSYA